MRVSGNVGSRGGEGAGSVNSEVKRVAWEGLGLKGNRGRQRSTFTLSGACV